MKWLVRCALVLVLATFVLMPCAHAATTTQGGACPSSANMDGGSGYTAYGGPFAAPTNCYYVDFQNGSDSNTGTDENHPFKHAVGMIGAGGNVPSGCSGGVGWIFRGGIAWDYTIFPWYVGANATCSGSSAGNDSYGGCTGANCVYFGVDHSWYASSSTTTVSTSGTSVTWVAGYPFQMFMVGQTVTIGGTNYTVASVSSNTSMTLTSSAGTNSSATMTNKLGGWTRPVFNAGDWSNPSTPTCYYDAPTASGYQPTNLINLSYQNDIIIDNFELTGACWAEVHDYVYPNINFIASGNGSGAGTNYTIENIYIHRSVYNASCLTLQYCGNLEYGIAMGNQASLHVTYNVFDFSDSGPTTTTTSGHSPQDPVWTGQAIFRGITYADHNVGYGMTDWSANAWGTLRDNLISWSSSQSVNDKDDPNAGYHTATHSHIQNDSGCSTPAYEYNNQIVTIGAGYLMDPQYGTPDNTCTIYFFNNLTANYNDGQDWNFGSTSAGITVYVFNNTMECGSDTSVYMPNSTDNQPANAPCGNWGSPAAAYIYNDHFITSYSGSGFVCGQTSSSGPCPAVYTSIGSCTNCTFTSWPGGNPSDLVQQSQPAANGQGYSFTQANPFSPTSGSGATVGVGVNKTSLCNSLPDSNAAAACKMETTGGVTYNTTNHTAVCCAIANPVARPATGAWDVGAYQFSAASGSAPQPPSGLTATVE